MAEYIDREIAKGSLRMNQHRFTCADEANGFGSVRWSEDVIYAEAAQKAIDTIPSADVVEVRHGKWVNGECSECGGDAPFWPMATTYYRSNFCPNCGARMEEWMVSDEHNLS